MNDGWREYTGRLGRVEAAIVMYLAWDGYRGVRISAEIRSGTGFNWREEHAVFYANIGFGLQRVLDYGERQVVYLRYYKRLAGEHEGKIPLLLGITMNSYKKLQRTALAKMADFLGL